MTSLSETAHAASAKAMDIKTVGLASDHAGFALKQFVRQYLDEKHIPYKDFGCFSSESCNYAEFGHLLGSAIESGEVYPGIGICGSGEGMAITLNKHQGIRAGLAWNTDIAELIRQHNDANILVMPARFITNKEAEAIMDKFFAASFEGGRHARRVAKIPVKGEAPAE